MNWIESLLGTARSRLSNPLAGSFILSWMVINWKIALILLSAEVPNAEKINLLTEADYFNGWNLFFWPLLFGIFLTVAIPLATWILEKKALNPIQEWRLEQRVNLTKIRAELEKLDDEWGTNEDLKSRLGESQAKNDSLRNENSILSEKNTKLRSELKTQVHSDDRAEDVKDDPREEISSEEARDYEDWKRETLRVLRKHMAGDVTSEFKGIANELFDQIRDSDARSLIDLKNKVLKMAAYSKSRTCSLELTRLANSLPSHPDEKPDFAEQ